MRNRAVGWRGTPRLARIVLSLATVIALSAVTTTLATTSPADAQTTPTLSVTVSSDGSLHATWTKAADEDSYEFLYDTSTSVSGGKATAVSSLVTNSDTTFCAQGSWCYPSQGDPLYCYWVLYENQTGDCPGHFDLADADTSYDTDPLQVGATYFVQVLVEPHCVELETCGQTTAPTDYWSNIVQITDNPSVTTTTTRSTTTSSPGSASVVPPPVGNVVAVVTAATGWFTEEVSCDTLRQSGVLTAAYRKDLATAASGSSLAYSATTIRQARSAEKVFDACMNSEQDNATATAAKATAQVDQAKATEDEQLAKSAATSAAADAATLAAQAAKAKAAAKAAARALAKAEATSRTASARCFVVYDSFGRQTASNTHLCPRPVVGAVGQK